MDLVTLVTACSLAVDPKIMHALIWHQSGGEPWSFTVRRHLDIRRVILRNRRPDGIRERGVGPVPRAVIGRDGAIDRIALEAWRGLAAFAELGDLARHERDVRARREHRYRRGSRVDKQARQPDPDCNVVTVRGTHRADRLAHGVIDLRLPLPRHRE